ncbi:sigma-70 family RNA polymerase sigma factor [Flavobacterium sp.]|uniref:RNA polymerase sigma factor n=1 Tax=Flavobacterium sp. TaxID=239 RepID=UPI002628BDEB|nr:sigma-70 family RNA polymerase sigma factor [Flavobacterium sp.]
MNNSHSKGICDEIIFSAFFKSNVKSLRNYLYFKFGNEEQSNDITQDAFIKLWENCSDVPPEKAKSFLYTVANNATLNQIAHQKVVLNYSKNNALNDRTNLNPEFLLEEDQFKTKLEKAIADLTEAQRTAFLLNRIEGKKYAEIAVMLNISVKAVEKRIHGALLSLRANIEQFK